MAVIEASKAWSGTEPSPWRAFTSVPGRRPSQPEWVGGARTPAWARARIVRRLVSRDKSGSPTEEGLSMSTTQTDVTRVDGVRVPASDYRPVWLESLADDVTIEGSAMNGVVQGADDYPPARRG